MAAPPPPGPPYFRSGSAARRNGPLVMWLSIFLVSGSLLLLGAAVGGYFLIRGTNPRFVDGVPADLPADVFVCNHAAGVQSFSITGPGTRKQFVIRGTCPVDHFEVGKAYVSELEYRGWTVHDGGGDGLTAYAFGHQEALEVTFSEDGSNSNATTIVEEVQTETGPPPRFDAAGVAAASTKATGYGTVSPPTRRTRPTR